MNSSKSRKPPRRVTDVDGTIGKRLHDARRSAGMSQQALGEALGVSFQQIQKYEKGKNRLSGSRLIRAAEVLKIGAGELLGPAMDRRESEDFDRLMATTEGPALVMSFLAMNPEERKGLLAAARDIKKMRTWRSDAHEPTA